MAIDVQYNPCCVFPHTRTQYARCWCDSISSGSSVSYDQRWTVIYIIRHQLAKTSINVNCLSYHFPTMATLVANRAMDVNGLAAAARTHTQAVTRNYISQPRLSMSLNVSSLLEAASGQGCDIQGHKNDVFVRIYS